MRPRLSYALFVVSGIAITCYSLRHFCKRKLHWTSGVRQVVPPDIHRELICVDVRLPALPTATGRHRRATLNSQSWPHASIQKPSQQDLWWRWARNTRPWKALKLFLVLAPRPEISYTIEFIPCLQNMYTVISKDCVELCDGATASRLQTPRNPAPRNHFLVWIVKPSGCHCTDGHLTSRAFTEDQKMSSSADPP